MPDEEALLYTELTVLLPQDGPMEMSKLPLYSQYATHNHHTDLLLPKTYGSICWHIVPLDLLRIHTPPPLVHRIKATNKAHTLRPSPRARTTTTSIPTSPASNYRMP